MQKEYAEYLLRKTKEDYNLIAEDFSKTRENPWEEFKFLFNDHLARGEKVLDLGCGNGRYFEFLKNKNVSYIGLDASEKLIKLAKKRFPQTKFLVGNALNLPFPDDYFDRIYGIAVFHQIPSLGLRLKFLEEAKRVLKQKGLLILTVWKAHQKRQILLILKYTILKLIGSTKLDFKDVFEPWGDKTERYYHYFSKRELKKLIDKTELKLKKIGVTKNKTANRQNIYLIAKKVPIV